MSAFTPPPLNLAEDFPPTEAAAWRAAAEAALKGAPFEKRLVTRTPEGIDLQPIYTREDAARLRIPLAPPGMAPFVRGNHTAGYRANPWLIAQETPVGVPEALNAVLLQDLAAGQTAVNLGFDPAGRHGLDPAAAGSCDVAACGASLVTAADWARAFAGLDPVAAPVRLYAGTSGLAALAGFVHWARSTGAKVDGLAAWIESDPIGEWIADGSLPLALDAAWDELAEATSWTAQHAPGVRTIGIRLHAWHDAGGNAVQELANGLAAAVETVRALMQRGLAFDDIAPRLGFSVSVGSHFFMEIAKLRALRWLWARVARAYGAAPDGQRTWIHARTSLFNRTTLDPYVNLLRGTTEAFSAVLANCDSLHVGAFDEVVRPPDDFARRVARNTQLVLWHESQVPQVADPAGGSWYLESLTDSLARRAWKAFQEIEAKGGLIPLLRDGSAQKAVAASAADRVKAVGQRREIVVGVNQYANATEEPLPVKLPDLPARRASRVADLKAQAKAADGAAVKAALAGVASSPGASRVDAAIAAVAAGATLGAICSAMHARKPGAEEIERVAGPRRAAGFEQLRAAVRAAAEEGRSTRVFLATMGPAAQHRARAEFARGFFEPGGFEVILPGGFKTVAEAVAAAKQSGAVIAVLCSTDESYPGLVPDFCAGMQEGLPDVVRVLAGYPEEQVEAYRAAGIDEFIHLRADCLPTLRKLANRIGIK
jgi:methylmalonyl-CoA mutase